MSILFATSELAPWVKTGGLGDVGAALPPALAARGADVRVLIPYYPALAKAFPNAPMVATLPAHFGVFPGAALREAITPEGIPLLLLDCQACYAREGNPYLGSDGRDWHDNAVRFGLLSYVAALLSSTASPLPWKPQVLHCHDWQTALAPVYLHYVLTPVAKSVLTIHNLAFQGLFGPHTLHELGLPPQAWNIDGVEYYGHLSFLKGGIQHANRVTTVSPTYAEEIRTDRDGMGMAGLLRWRGDALSGILNGIDDAQWNPATDRYLAAKYSRVKLGTKLKNKQAVQARMDLPVTDEMPLFGVVSRLSGQKGLDLLLACADALVKLPAQLVVLGSGDAGLEQSFRELAQRHPEQVAVRIGFDESLAHLIEAGCDSFLMPSRFEPCGLNQMYSLRYGTPPIVRATGGLADTIVDATDKSHGNGFVFERAEPTELLNAIRRAAALWKRPRLWRDLQKNAMAAEHGWEHPAQQYAALYTSLTH
ncbi:MAG TPA: glycogen synthase GlgA [Rhodocyclaceae bacterium]|nr:glycogen synthase GlgA [Rhodocyclaceae bacterium]